MLKLKARQGVSDWVRLSSNWEGSEREGVMSCQQGQIANQGGVLEVPDCRISTTERLSDRKLTQLEAHWDHIGKLPQR